VAASVKPGAVLDGEVVVHRKLRRLIFIVFDVLANLANEPILHLPFEQRLHHPKQASIVEKGVSVDVFDHAAIFDPNIAVPLVRQNFVKRADLEGNREESEITLLQNNDGAAEEKADSENVGTNGATDDIMRAEEPASVARSRVSLSSTRATSRGSSIKRMYCACQSCYLFTIFISIILYVVGMSYAPREPQYNVCTNEVAWKSIVEGMASLKMSASFDLLISVYIPN